MTLVRRHVLSVLLHTVHCCIQTQITMHSFSSNSSKFMHCTHVYTIPSVPTLQNMVSHSCTVHMYNTSEMPRILGERERPHWLWPESHTPCRVFYDSRLNMALELFTGGQHGRCVRGKQFSTIAAMCMDGIIDVHITTGSVDSETFCEFIEHCLQPQLLPYDGANPRSVVNYFRQCFHSPCTACNRPHSGNWSYSSFSILYLPIHLILCQSRSAFRKYLRGYDPLVPYLRN